MAAHKHLSRHKRWTTACDGTSLWNSAHTGTRPFTGAANPNEVFSSDGPRKVFFNPDGTPITPGNLLFGTNGGTTLAKPDVAAADGGSTKTPGFLPFFGTSAAAPAHSVPSVDFELDDQGLPWAAPSFPERRARPGPVAWDTSGSDPASGPSRRAGPILVGMFWIVLAHDCVGSHATLFEGKPPREGMDEGGTVELHLLGATEDLGAAIAAVESLESRLRDQRRAVPRRVPSVLTVAKEGGAT